MLAEPQLQSVLCWETFTNSQYFIKVFRKKLNYYCLANEMTDDSPISVHVAIAIYFISKSFSFTSAKISSQGFKKFICDRA